MKFVKLTRAETGIALWVDPLAVDVVTTCSETGHTIVGIGKEEYHVKDAPEDVVRMIGEELP